MRIYESGQNYFAGAVNFDDFLAVLLQPGIAQRVFGLAGGNDFAAVFHDDIGFIDFLLGPMRSKVRRPPGRRDSPILKRGNFPFSKIKTFHPCFASKVPAVLPAGPPAHDNDVEEHSVLRRTLGIGWSCVRIRDSCRYTITVQIPVMSLRGYNCH